MHVEKVENMNKSSSEQIDDDSPVGCAGVVRCARTKHMRRRDKTRRSLQMQYNIISASYNAVQLEIDNVYRWTGWPFESSSQRSKYMPCIADAAGRSSLSSAELSSPQSYRRGTQGRLGRDFACEMEQRCCSCAAKKTARQIGGLVTSEWGLQPAQPSASAPP